jgi:murein DD-endopeptidase MepM/ murein hydrolase activator NlpD
MAALCPVKGPCRIVQRFDGRPEFYQPLGLKSHGGLDITGPTPGVSVPLYAPEEGEVVVAGFDGDYGLCVRILTPPNKLGQRKEYVLGHHATIEVKKGDWIHQGDHYGMMGRSGLADGVHVHFARRLHDANGNVMWYDNGWKGYLPFGTKESPEAYVIFWGDPAALHLVSYPYG